MPENFFLDTDEGSEECRIITSLYSKTRQKHFLIYQPLNHETEEFYVSTYNPDLDEDEYDLKSVTEEEELEEVAKLLQEFYDEVK